MARFPRHEHQHPRAAQRSGKVRRPGVDRPDLPQLVGLHRQQLCRADRLWAVESVCGLLPRPTTFFVFSRFSFFFFLLYPDMKRSGNNLPFYFYRLLLHRITPTTNQLTCIYLSIYTALSVELWRNSTKFKCLIFYHIHHWFLPLPIFLAVLSTFSSIIAQKQLSPPRVQDRARMLCYLIPSYVYIQKR
jgi:hypothetical protein